MKKNNKSYTTLATNKGSWKKVKQQLFSTKLNCYFSFQYLKYYLSMIKIGL